MAATTAPTPSEPSILHIDALPVGTRLSEFELLGLLGVGGFGMVYRAYDHSLQRPVAIKEYMPSALAGRAAGMSVSMRSSVDEQTFVAGLKSFMAEARLLAQFDHPSLVKVFRVWEANNTAYMVMPFYNGITLKQARTQMRSPPSEDWLRRVMWSMLEALKVLHAAHTVHRDVSPDNIFLQDIGPPVLLDLGAARRAIGDKSQRHTAILKVNYAPIEQYADAEDMRQGPWTDLYSLAAVVHGVLCNDAPVPATFRVLRDRLPSVASVAETVHQQFGIDYSPAFVQALSQALAIRPEERPQNVAAFAGLMGLTTPSGMRRFDWRAELGDIWVAPGTADAAAAPAVEVSAPQQRTQWTQGPASEMTQAFASAAGGPSGGVGDGVGVETRQAGGLGDNAAAHIELPIEKTAIPLEARARPEVVATEPAPLAGQPVRHHKTLVWGLVGLAVVLAAAFAAFVQRQAEPPVEEVVQASPPALPVSAASATAAAAVAKPLPEAMAPEPSVAAVSQAAASAASSSASATQRAASADAATARAAQAKASAPARTVAAAKASAPFQAPAASAVTPVMPRPQPTTARPEPGIASPPAAAQPSAAPSAPVHRPEPARAPTPPVLTATQLCPDSNFFTRPMCVFRECQKPQFASLPVCVENNNRLQSGNRPQ